MEIYEYQLNNLRNKINNFNETLSNLTEQVHLPINIRFIITPFLKLNETFSR